MVAGDLASMHWAATYGILYRRTQLVDSTLSLRGLQMPFDASGALILHLLSIRKVSKALGLSKTLPVSRRKKTRPPRWAAQCQRASAAVFLHSQGATGFGSLHNPRLASRASCSRSRSTVSRRAYR